MYAAIAAQRPCRLSVYLLHIAEPQTSAAARKPPYDIEQYPRSCEPAAVKYDTVPHRKERQPYPRQCKGGSARGVNSK